VTPSEYFRELVEPTIAEFEVNPASVRHAYAACMFAYHFADAVAIHMVSTGAAAGIRDELGRIRGELAALTPCFRMVEGIAAVAKHLEATRTPVRPKVEDTHIGSEVALWTDDKGNVALWTDSEGNVALWEAAVVCTRDEHGNPINIRDCMRQTGEAIENYLAREKLS
jgi:hypothetical protein